MTAWAQIAVVVLGVLLIETMNVAAGGEKPVVIMAWELMKRRRSWWLGLAGLMFALFALASVRPGWVYGLF